MTRRVVVTGCGIVSALGDSWVDLKSALQESRSAVRLMHEWDGYEGLEAKIAAPVDHFTMPSYYKRKQTRSMDRVAKLGVCAAENALQDAGLLEDKEFLSSGDVGVACGSAAGGAAATSVFAETQKSHYFGQITPNTYIKMSGQTACINIAIALGITGRLIPVSSACTSASQSIGFAYESILSGAQDVMVAGGAEELMASQLAVFDNVMAASRCNSNPTTRPAPFDALSDGVVMGEGAGFIVLEEYERAVSRGAKIYAELVSFATNNDAKHITQPDAQAMQKVMQRSLDLAGICADDIGYISGHGTASYSSDRAESEATHAVFGERTPFSTLKSYLGHSLGACAGIESAALVNMMQDQWFHPTLNLQQANPEFAKLGHIMGKGAELDTQFTQLNNFAFGGINTSLVFKVAPSLDK